MTSDVRSAGDGFRTGDRLRHAAKVVSLKPLKEMAPSLDEPLRSLILSQPDEISAEEYKAKAIEWWKLARLIYQA